jgi:hypothetical protein
MGLRSVLAQFRLTASPGLRRDADSEFGRRWRDTLKQWVSDGAMRGRGRALMSSPGHTRAYQATERSGHRDEAERSALAHTRTLCHPGTV